ncbi:MAG: cell division protein FtsL [Holosporaceae bacterium]|nr:cell division protein FtsL [Holosporaceae bacterium]
MITKKSSLFFAVLVCIIGSWMFYLKYTVVSIEDRIRAAKRELIIEKKSNHILKAEWKTLTSPERIQRLAIKHLGMKAIEPAQLREFDPSIFHGEKSKYPKIRKLAKLVDEILSARGSN